MWVCGRHVCHVQLNALRGSESTVRPRPLRHCMCLTVSSSHLEYCKHRIHTHENFEIFETFAKYLKLSLRFRCFGTYLDVSTRGCVCEATGQ